MAGNGSIDGYGEGEKHENATNPPVVHVPIMVPTVQVPRQKKNFSIPNGRKKK